MVENVTVAAPDIRPNPRILLDVVKVTDESPESAPIPVRPPKVVKAGELEPARALWRGDEFQISLKVRS